MQDKNRNNNWKAKSLERSKTIKACKREIRRLKKNRDKWKNQYKVLQVKTKLTKIKGHRYPMEFIWIGIYMRITLNVSLRSVSKSLKEMSLILGLALPCIEKLSSTTIRNWSLKYGHYALHKDLEKREYALICDESIVIGQEQVLLILAVPIDNKSYITPLSMQDVRVVSVEVKSSWKSEAIASLIRSTMAKEGIEVRYVISDNGTALGAAYKLCGLPKIADCTHQMANILQKLYSKDTQLSGFVKQMNATRAKWVKSRYIVYLPPTLRAKSRFHQLFTISQWAQLMLVKWSKMPIIVQEELIYLKENEVFIAQMCIINQLVKDLGLILKSEGIHLKTTLKCENLFREIEVKTDEERIRKFIAQMRDYIKEQQKQLPNMTQILCCSDIIESMFGKYKNKKNTHEMLTEDVLTIAAFGGNMSCEDVKAACANTKIKDVQKWKKEKTIPSVITLKKQFKAA